MCVHVREREGGEKYAKNRKPLYNLKGVGDCETLRTKKSLKKSLGLGGA